MGYKFRTDLHIEYPFFLEMSHKLRGLNAEITSMEKKHLGVCALDVGSTKRLWDMPVKRHLYPCLPVDGCDLGGMTLHDLIKRYGGDSMFNRWRKARWQTKFAPYVERDRRNRTDFQQCDWRVVVVWECELHQPSAFKERLDLFPQLDQKR